MRVVRHRQVAQRAHVGTQNTTGHGLEKSLLSLSPSLFQQGLDETNPRAAFHLSVVLLCRWGLGSNKQPQPRDLHPWQDSKGPGRFCFFLDSAA